MLRKTFRNLTGVACLSLLAAAGCSPQDFEPGAAQTGQTNQNLSMSAIVMSLGANYNEASGNARTAQLDRMGITWARGIIDMVEIYSACQPDFTAACVAAQNDVVKFNQLKTVHGRKTVLNLRFSFREAGQAPPAEFTPRWDNYVTLLPAVLAQVMPNTNILVAGNEPFIETAPEDWDLLIPFYVKMATRANTFKLNQGYTGGNNVPLLVGAFDNIDEGSNATNPTRVEFLRWARDTQFISGADFHAHVSTITEFEEGLDWMTAGLRNAEHALGQQFVITTEFSMKDGFWNQNGSPNNMELALNAAFKSAWSGPAPKFPATINTNAQYINYALNNPRPVAEWNDWNVKTPFLSGRKQFLCNAWLLLKARPKFKLAFFEITQGNFSSYVASSPPWLLSSALTDLTTVNTGGEPSARWGYYKDFTDITATGNCSVND